MPGIHSLLDSLVSLVFIYLFIIDPARISVNAERSILRRRKLKLKNFGPEEPKSKLDLDQSVSIFLANFLDKALCQTLLFHTSLERTTRYCQGAIAVRVPHPVGKCIRFRGVKLVWNI